MQPRLANRRVFLYVNQLITPNIPVYEKPVLHYFRVPGRLPIQ